MDISVWGLNWIDILIIFAFLAFALEGWQIGAIELTMGITASMIAGITALSYHRVVGEFITRYTGITASLSSGIGFLVLVLITPLLLSVFLLIIQPLFKNHIRHIWDRIFGIVVSIPQTIIIIGFVELTLLILPFDGVLSDSLQSSRLSQLMIFYGSKYSPVIHRISHEENKKPVMLALGPNEHQSMAIPFRVQEWNLLEDANSENILYTYIANERLHNAQPKIEVNPTLQKIARIHSRSMLLSGSVSHIDINSRLFKENSIGSDIRTDDMSDIVVFAPTIYSAIANLSTIPDFTSNILFPKYRYLGIGIIETGGQGIMITILTAGKL